jgi:hypothetical protein
VRQGAIGEVLILRAHTQRAVQVQYQVIAVHRQRVDDGSPRRRDQIRLYPITLPQQKLAGNSVEHNRGSVRSCVISSDRGRMTGFHLTNVSTTLASSA